MRKTVMNALRVDQWQHSLRRGFMETYSIDEASEQMLRELFAITDELKSALDDDDVKVFWIWAKRPTFKQYKAYYYDDEESANVTEEDKKEYYKRDFPNTRCWYKLQLVHHERRNEDYYGVILSGVYLLSINDVNTKESWKRDATELLKWLIEQATDVVQRVKDGTYNAEIDRMLPMEYRWGKILRKDYWDIYPERRASYRQEFTQQEIDKFLEYVEEMPQEGDEGWYPPDAWSSITARQYYEACGVVYRALDLPPREIWRFHDSDAEHERYGESTPKELYYTYADGRDDGLVNVPMDDPQEMKLWLNNAGDYYEFNGSHPWEIRGSMSISHSMHLWIRENRSTGQYYFGLSGDTLARSIETIHAYLVLRKAGYPVELIDGRKIAARLTETDYIEILPGYRSSLYGSSSSTMLDAVNLEDGNDPKAVIAKAIWRPERSVELKE